jgi:hypothetical protein
VTAFGELVRNSARHLANQLRVDSIVAEASSAISRYVRRRTWLSSEQRAWRTAQTGIYHRVVWSVPGDALADGWSTRSGDGQDVTSDIDETFAIEDALLEARAAARQDGGAWLWPVTSDEDWSQPIGTGPHEVSALHVLTESEVTVIDLERDARSPRWGRPSLVSITAQRDGMSWSLPRVHASRLIYVSGAPATPNQQTAKRGYDLPVLELYRQALDDYEAGAGKVGRLLERLSMPWVRMKNGVATTAAGGNDYEERLTLLNQGMGGPGLLLLLGEDEAGWAGPTLAGVRDAINVQAERISAVEGIPLSRLFGQAPGGLSTDDKAGKAAYDAVLERERKLLGPVLTELYEFMLGIDAAREIVWPSLTKLTPVEEANISLMRAQRGVALVDSGAITGDDERRRFEEPGKELPLPVLIDPNAAEKDEADEEVGEFEVVPAPGGALPGPVEDVQKTALNGAQVTSALEIVQSVAARELPRETGIAMLVSFFNLSEPEAAKIMGEVGATFFAEPKAEPPPAKVEGDAGSNDDKPGSEDVAPPPPKPPTS